MKYLLNSQESERISFREIRESDFNEWLAFFRNPLTHQHWTPLQNPPEIECQKWYAKQFWRYENSMGGMNALVEKQTGKLIGHCGLLVQTVDEKTELEIGYSLLPEFWNCGYASESAKKCRDFAFDNKFSESLISIISKTNIPSQRVATRNGMSLEKATDYHGNEVLIFRIFYLDWLTENPQP